MSDETKIPPDALDSVPRAGPEVYLMVAAIDRMRGVERLPDLSAMPSVEEFPDPEQAVELLREMERLIAREQQPWWRKALRRIFGRNDK